MRKNVTNTCLGLLVVFGVVAGAEDKEPNPVESRIGEVTVYADRARVTRSGKVELPGGTTTLAFTELPGWIDEASVRLAIEPASAGSITDLQVKREYLARATDEDLRAAQLAVQQVSDEVAVLDDRAKVLQARAAHVEAIRVFSLEKLPKDAAVRVVSVEEYGQVVDFVTESLAGIAGKHREIQAQRRELGPELAARQKKLSELHRLKQLEQTTIMVTIDSMQGGDAELVLTYLLPGATWEPVHELRSEGDDPKAVDLLSFAVVTQTTGEDWQGAHISFSTQSPTETIRIPELDALLLGRGAGAARLVRGNDGFVVAQTKYREQNVLWNNAFNPDAAIQQLNDSNIRQYEVQDRSARIFRKLQNRGTTTHFAGQGTPLVRSDGRPVRVRLGKVGLAAESRIVAAPEISLNAARTLDLVNNGDQPLLPGKVSLYQGGAFLGTTELDFIAGGEEFALFLGVADQVKLSRVLDRKRSSLVRGKRTRMQAAFEISVENLSDLPASVNLTDRIPVSEHKDIRVSRVQIEPEGKPDEKGLLKWKLDLEPGEKRTLRIGYTVEYPPEEVERLNKKRAANGMPSAEADLSLQIMNLEKSF